MSGDDFDLTVRCLVCGDALTPDFDCVACDEKDGLAEAANHFASVTQAETCTFGCFAEVYRNDTCFECWSEMHDQPAN